MSSFRLATATKARPPRFAQSKQSATVSVCVVELAKNCATLMDEPPNPTLKLADAVVMRARHPLPRETEISRLNSCQSRPPPLPPSPPLNRFETLSRPFRAPQKGRRVFAPDTCVFGAAVSAQPPVSGLLFQFIDNSSILDRLAFSASSQQNLRNFSISLQSLARLSWKSRFLMSKSPCKLILSL